ncbi:MAG: PspA/IM30 family protein, partial [Myxococcales bacterium]|nr:PspA/IM30 family protein [Myxococcales bacterium]
MGLFSRIGTLFRSNINELINKAEDPEKMLNQVLVDMKQQLVEAKKQVAVAIADEKRLKKQHETEAAKAAEWEKKAMLAIRAGDDNLARAALQRKKSHDEIASSLLQQWTAQKQSVDQLKEALRSLDSKIEEAKRKRNLLVSRQKRAEAQRTINETLAGINNTSAFDTFERMADRVTQIEAEAEASSEMSLALEAADSSLESQFKALEAGPGVDDELEALKTKMALKAAEQRQLAAGADAAPPEPSGAKTAADGAAAGEVSDEEMSAAEIDAQLEELK